MKAINKINMNEMRADVMHLAWDFARTAAVKFGGTAREYVNACVKRAWHVVKRDYERVNNEVFLTTVCKLFEEDYNTTMNYKRLFALLQNQNDISMHMNARYNFYEFIYSVIYNTVCTVVSGKIAILHPMEIRKNLIAMGVESSYIIKQCCDSAGFLFGMPEFDYEYREEIYSHIDKCIDITKGISRMYDTVEMLRNYVETKRVYNEITEFEMYEFKKHIDNHARWKTKGRF